MRWLVGNSRIDRELRDRTHIERIASLGLHRAYDCERFGNRRLRAARRVLRSIRSADDDDDVSRIEGDVRAQCDGRLRSTRTTSRRTRTNDDVNNYNFQQQIRAINFAKDRDVVGALNARLPLRTSNASTSFLKFGFKYRDKAKGRDRNESTFATPATLKMTELPRDRIRSASLPGRTVRPDAVRQTEPRGSHSRHDGRSVHAQSHA